MTTVKNKTPVGPTDSLTSTVSVSLHTSLPSECWSRVEVKKSCLQTPGFREDTASTISADTIRSRTVKIPGKEGDKAHNDTQHIAWYHLPTILRGVAYRKQITGREFNILNGWVFLLLMLVHGIIFTTLAFLSILNTHRSAPVSEKLIALACMSLAWLLVFVEVGLTCGYLLTKPHNALARSRGRLYILVTALSIPVCVTVLFVANLGQISILDMSQTVITVLKAASGCSSIIFLGAQACRQRLIYQLFEVKMTESHTLYYTSYVCLFIWTALVGVVYCAVGFTVSADQKFLCGIPINIGFQVVLWITVYYTFKSRRITVAFSDWRSNGLVSLLFTGVAIPIFILHAKFFEPAAGQDLAKEKQILMVAFVMYFGICSTLGMSAAFLFGQISVLAFFDVQTIDELNPQSTFAGTGIAQRGPVRSDPTADVDSTTATCTPASPSTGSSINSLG